MRNLREETTRIRKRQKHRNRVLYAKYENRDSQTGLAWFRFGGNSYSVQNFAAYSA